MNLAWFAEVQELQIVLNAMAENSYKLVLVYLVILVVWNAMELVQTIVQNVMNSKFSTMDLAQSFVTQTMVSSVLIAKAVFLAIQVARPAMVSFQPVAFHVKEIWKYSKADVVFLAILLMDSSMMNP